MFPFQGYRSPILRNEHAVSAGGTYDEIEIGPVPPGRLWVLDWVAGEDLTTNFTSLWFYIGRLGQPQFLFEDVTCTLGRLYSHQGPVYIPEDRSLVIRFVGATNLDQLKAYVTGFEVHQPDAPWPKTAE